MSQLSRDKLSDEGLRAALAGLRGWDLVKGELTKTFEFDSYLSGIDFAVEVAKEAEALDHHPNLMVGYRRVTVSVSTHDAGGITAWDFELAARADKLATI